MREVEDNIWDYHARGHWVVVTTNGVVRADGACVMGRGIAAQAKKKYPRLPYHLGRRIRDYGNHVHLFPDYRIISFPVKHKWFERADLELITRSTKELSAIWDSADGQVFLVRPGCGNGQLDWSEVKPVIEPFLDDRFTVVEMKH